MPENKRPRPLGRPLIISWFLILGFLQLAYATTVVPPTFEELVLESDYVVHGKVAAVESVWEQRGRSRMIVTRVTVDVLEVITGTPPEPLVLTMLGGRVGAQEMVIEGAPRFEVGNEDILFIAGNGRNISPIARIMYGRYRIVSETDGSRRIVLRDNGEPLRRTADVSESLHAEEHDHDTNAAAAALPPMGSADFVEKIRAVKRGATTD